MAKVITITWVAVNPEPKKHSVKYGSKQKDIDKNALFNGVYAMRSVAKHHGIKDLDDIEEIEVTAKIKLSGTAKSRKEEDEEEEGEEED